jgi:hypothetical protein
MEEYQFKGRVDAGVKKPCQICKVPKLLTEYQVRRRTLKSGEISVTVDGKCLVCTRATAKKNSNKKHIPTGGTSGVQKEHENTGFSKNSPEYDFFCK